MTGKANFWHQNSASPLLAQIPPLPSQAIFHNRPGTTNPNLFKYQPKKIYSKKFGRRDQNYNSALSYLRQIIDTKGIFTVAPYMPANDPDLQKLHHYLYGMTTGSLVYGDQYREPDAEPIKRPGLALHPGSPELCHAYLGDENPHLSWRHTMDKWEEYCAIEQYAPGTLLPTFLLKKEHWYQAPEFQSKRYKLKKHILKSQGPLPERLLPYIESYIKYLLDQLREKYPQGVHLKHVVGCYTADNNTIFNTNQSCEKKLAKSFFDAYNALHAFNLESARQGLLNQADNRPLIIFETLFYPRNVILSPHVELDKTPTGEAREVRVDALRFNPITAWPRHCAHDFCLPHMRTAMTFITQLKEKLPKRYHDMSFGADVVFIDGQPKIPDLNPGGDSGFLMIAVQYQAFIHHLTAKKPPLIATLHAVSRSPIAQQSAFLHGLPQTILAHPQVDNVSETAIYLRNLQLLEWHQAGAKKEEIKTCIKKIEQLFASNPCDLTKDEMIQSSLDFFNLSSATNIHMEAVSVNTLSPALYPG